MSDILKPCPLCGCKLVPFGHDFDRRVNPPVVVENFKHPYADENDTSKDCELSMLIFTARRWNIRPREDALFEILKAQQSILHDVDLFNGHSVGTMENCAKCQAVLAK